MNLNAPSRNSVTSTASVYAPILEDSDMPRRQYQDPKLKTRDGAHGQEYYIRYRIKVIRKGADGKPAIARREKHHFLGLVKDLTERAAKRKKDEIMREVNGQVYSFQAHIPFSDFIGIFREKHLPTLAVPTQKTYDQWLRIHIEPAFAGKKLCDVTILDTKTFLDGLEVAPQTRCSIRGVLASIFKQAVEWGYWKEVSPVAKIGKRGKTPKYVKAAIPIEDLQKLLMAVRPDVKLIIETLVFTGMRISECLGLKKKAVNLDRGYLMITERNCRGDVDVPKSTKGRRALPLANLAEQFKVWCASLQPDDYLFKDSEGRPYKDCVLLANYLTPILVKLGIKKPGMGWHAFRHTHGTWFSEEGADDFEVMDQLGHADIGTSRIYIHPRMGRREEIVRKMQERMALTMPGEGSVQ
jgi:integrase